jgi:hypothetical protein
MNGTVKCPINLTLCQCKLNEITPEDFGNFHKLEWVKIRSKKHEDSKKTRKLVALPDEFDGTLNKKRYIITAEQGYDGPSINLFNTDIFLNKKQSICFQEDRVLEIDKHTVNLYQNNNLLNNLIQFFNINFPTYEMQLVGFQTIVPNNGRINNNNETIKTRWEKTNTVKDGVNMALRMTYIDNIKLQDNPDIFSNRVLKDIAGTYRENGLAEDVCKVHPADSGKECLI